MASTKRIMGIMCTVLLILIFAASGVMKLTPMMSPEIHNQLRGQFRSFVNVPPVNQLKLEPDVYRTIVGVVELVCAVCLACPDSHVQLMGHYVLMVIMVGAIWTHYYVRDTIDMMVPALACLTLLMIRLYTCGKVKVKVKTT